MTVAERRWGGAPFSRAEHDKNGQVLDRPRTCTAEERSGDFDCEVLRLLGVDVALAVDFLLALLIGAGVILSVKARE